MKLPGAKTLTNFSLILYVCFSVLGLAILPFLLFQSAKFQVSFPPRSFLVGCLYSLVCMLGIVAVYYPKKCQNTFSFRKNVALQKNSQLGKGSDLAFEGHHPNCRKFDGNRTKILGFVLCSACTGLLLGAILALIGAASYFFFGTIFPLADLRILLVASVAMLLGMAQFVFRTYLKLIVNSLFVVGSLIMLISADLIGGNLLIDLYVLGLIVFLLLTRIMLSEWNNRKTCLECGSCKFSY
jgi:hypothetical protein